MGLTFETSPRLWARVAGLFYLLTTAMGLFALNIIFGVVYTLITLMTMWDYAFYKFWGVIEVTLTGFIVFYAWRLPRQEAA